MTTGDEAGPFRRQAESDARAAEPEVAPVCTDSRHTTELPVEPGSDLALAGIAGLPPDLVQTAISDAVQVHLSASAQRDFVWSARLLRTAGLPTGLAYLIALEGAIGLESLSHPCIGTWLLILDAACSRDAALLALREALALALDARQAVRDSMFDAPGRSVPEPVEAVRTLYAEAQLIRDIGRAFRKRRTDFSRSSG